MLVWHLLALHKPEREAPQDHALSPRSYHSLNVSC